MKKKPDINIISIFLSSMVVGGGVSGVNAILQKLTEAFPSIAVSTVYLVSTMPSLLAMVLTLLLGPLVGRKIGYRPVLLTGLACCLIGGVLPVWLNSSFYLILFFRAVFGVGLGCLAFRNAIIMNSYEGDKRAKYLGIGIIFQNVGAILTQFVAGILGDIRYNIAFYVFTLALAPLLLGFFYLKDPMKEVPKISTEDPNAGRLKISSVIWILGGAHFFVTMSYNMILLNNASMVAFKNFGSAGAAGVLQSCYTLGAVLGGATFSSVSKLAKKYIVSLYAAIIAVGTLLIYFAQSPVVYGAGMLLCGFVTVNVFPLLLIFAGYVTDAANMAMSMSIISTAGYCGNFLATYFISFSAMVFGGDLLFGPLISVLAVCAIFGIFFTIKDPRPKER